MQNYWNLKLNCNYFVFFIKRLEFPEFWKEIEEQLGAKNNEIHQIKTVLHILGYQTKASISSLNEKSISKLEAEFLKEKHRFAEETAEIKYFPSGFHVTLSQIVHLLNSKLKCDEGDSKRIQDNLFQQAKQVSWSMSMWKLLYFSKNKSFF